MAHAQAKIDIPVDPDFLTALKKFMADVQRFQLKAQTAFQQQQTVLRTLPPHRYGGFVGQLNKITKSIEKMALNIDRITDRLINNAFGYLGKAFMRGITAMIPFLETLIPLVAGPIGTLISAATFIYSLGRSAWNFMMWVYDKMIGLGDAVLKDAVLSSGVGASIGGLRAFRAIFGGLGLTSQVFETAARGRGDPSSLAYGLLRNLGIKNTGDTADMLTELLIKGRRFLLKHPPDVRHKIAKSVGLEEWLGTELVYILPRLREEEIQEMARQYREAKKVMQLTPEAVEGWKSFSINMRSVWPRIEKVIGDLLADPKTGLLSKMKALSEAVTNFIREILKTKLVDQAAEVIGGWIHNLTDYLSSDAPKKSLREAKRAIIGIVKQLDALSKRLRALLDFLGKGEPYVTIDKNGRITLHYRPGDRGVHPGRTMTPGAMREREQRTGVPRTRTGAGPPSAGPLPDTYPVGPPGTRYDPVSGTSLGGGVGSDSASRGRGGHQGVDIMAPYGSPVYANMDGVIERFGTDNFGQPTVTIRHADGTYSVYLHMQNRLGKVGDRVRGGQQIGTSGTANGVPHLHFERWLGPPRARGSRLLDPSRESGWDRRNLPRGAQPSRTNRDQPQPQTPPAATTPPDARRVQPRPAPAPTPDPDIPPIHRPRQGAPHIPTPVPPTGRRTTPTPTPRPPTSTSATPRPIPTPTPRPPTSTSATPTTPPTTPAPAPTIPSPRARPPSARRTPTAPVAPTPAAPAAPTPVRPAPVTPTTPTRTVVAGPNGRVDEGQLYQYLVEKYRNSSVNGYVPPDGAQWGITKGTPEEWAAFSMAVARQESNFNTNSYNGRDPGGSLGIFQFGSGQTLFTKGGNQADPQQSADAMVRAVEHYTKPGFIWYDRHGVPHTGISAMGQTMGSVRRPNEAGQYIPWATTLTTKYPTRPQTPKAWGGEEIRRTLRPGMPGTPSGPAPQRPPPFETTQDALRPALPGTPGGPSIPSDKPTAPTIDANRGPLQQSPRGPWQDLPIVPEKQRGIVTKPGQSQSIVDLTNVDSRLRESLARAKTDFEAAHPGYTIQAYSGHREGKQAQHGAKTGAVDVYVVGPDGKRIPNSGGDTTGLYTDYARRTYGYVLKDHPELKDAYEWGGSFGTERGKGGGPPDLMHHDLGGGRGTRYPQNNIRKLGPIMPDENSPGYRPPNADANPPTTSGSPSISSEPSNQSISPSASSQPSDQPVQQNRFSSSGIDPEKQYTPSGLKTSPSGEAPTAIIFHNTENHLSPKKQAEIWAGEKDPKRRGVGASLIVDRDGTIHDVYKEYKYGGTDNIARDYTPQELKDQGIVNSKVMGVEFIAKNDRDLTPAQIEAGKKIARMYPHSRALSHSKVNPVYDPAMKGPHRKPGEGDRIADEVNKERAKDPDYMEPGSAGEYLKKHLKEFEDKEEKKEKEPGKIDTDADRVNLAELNTGTRNDAVTQIRYNTRTGEKEPEQDPRELQKAVEKIEPGSEEDWLLRKERALQEAGPGTPEWKEAHPPRDYGPGTGLPAPGEIENEMRDLGTVKKPEVDVAPRYRDRRDIGPGWKFDPKTGQSLDQPINYEPKAKDLNLDDTKTRGDEAGGLPSGGAAAFLRNQFKQLQQDREEGKRSLTGMTQEAAAKGKKVSDADKPYEADPSKRGPEHAPGREDPYAPFYAKESTVFYTGPTGSKSVTYKDPASGQTYTDRTKPIGPPSSGLHSDTPGVATNYLRTPQRGKETLRGYYLITPTEGPNKGKSFIFPHSDTGPGVKGGAEKLDYNAAASIMVYGDFKPRGGSYVQYLGKELPDDIGIGELPPGLESRFKLGPDHLKYIQEQNLLRRNPGGIGSDAVAQAKADRANEQQSGNEDRSQYSKPNRDRHESFTDDDTITQKDIDDKPAPKRTRQPKIHKDSNTPVDTRTEENTQNHAEHETSPSRDDESDATKGGQIESPA